MKPVWMLNKVTGKKWLISDEKHLERLMANPDYQKATVGKKQGKKAAEKEPEE